MYNILRHNEECHKSFIKALKARRASILIDNNKDSEAEETLSGVKKVFHQEVVKRKRRDKKTFLLLVLQIKITIIEIQYTNSFIGAEKTTKSSNFHLIANAAVIADASLAPLKPVLRTHKTKAICLPGNFLRFTHMKVKVCKKTRVFVRVCEIDFPYLCVAPNPKSY